MTNKLNIALVLAVSVCASAASAEMVEKTMKGTLTDSMCKLDHASMIKMGHASTAAECAQMCIKEGSKLIFIDSKTKIAYELQNAGAAKKFAGQTVTLGGHVDTKKKIIHVHSVKKN